MYTWMFGYVLTLTKSLSVSPTFDIPSLWYLYMMCPGYESRLRAFSDLDLICFDLQ